MNSKGNSIVGFALIGVILLLFSWYNAKNQPKQQVVVPPAPVEEVTQEPAREPVNEAPLYQSATLQAAARAQAQFVTLENDKLSVTLSSKGAQPWAVLVKDYFT